MSWLTVWGKPLAIAMHTWGPNPTTVVVVVVWVAYPPHLLGVVELSGNAHMQLQDIRPATGPRFVAVDNNSMLRLTAPTT